MSSVIVVWSLTRSTGPKKLQPARAPTTAAVTVAANTARTSLAIGFPSSAGRGVPRAGSSGRLPRRYRARVAAAMAEGPAIR